MIVHYVIIIRVYIAYYYVFSGSLTVDSLLFCHPKAFLINDNSD